MSTDAILNQGELDVILTAHATKVNRTEPNLTEPQTCLACQNHALTQPRLSCVLVIICALYSTSNVSLFTADCKKIM